MTIDSDVSVVYENDTVDFGTIAGTAVIENTQLRYIPIRLACGVCAYCSPDVLSNCPMVLRSIQADLTRAFKLLPLSVHDLIHRTNLWLNWECYSYGRMATPTVLRHVTTHHGSTWLTEIAHDTPRKAKSIEIYSVVDYQLMRLHWNGSGLLIHELCHLIHQCCLEDGLDNKIVEALYERATLSGKYETVLRRDWAGRTKYINDDTGKKIIEEPADVDLAYAMIDKKEFFAEMSVAFLCDGYQNIERGNVKDMNACNPPLLHPDVIETVLSQRQNDPTINTNLDLTTHHHYCYQSVDSRRCEENDKQNLKYSINEYSEPCLPIITRLVDRITFVAFQRQQEAKDNNHLRMIDPVFRNDALSRECVNNYHCNKFYPFTRGQLRYYDFNLFSEIQELWKTISLWEDPYALQRRSRWCCQS